MDPENPEMSLVKFALWWYSVVFSELETGDRTILIITITSFYTFNHRMPENRDEKTLSYTVARHSVYNTYDIYYICNIYMY